MEAVDTSHTKDSADSLLMPCDRLDDDSMPLNEEELPRLDEAELARVQLLSAKVENAQLQVSLLKGKLDHLVEVLVLRKGITGNVNIDPETGIITKIEGL